MQTWSNFINQRLNKLTTIRRQLAKINYDPRLLVVKTKHYLNFVSNDYLGLSNHRQIKKAVVKTFNKYGIGSTGAPSLSGYSIEHEKLANNLATWLKCEQCLLFNSGYQLNIGLFSQLVDSNTIIWLDKNCHASHIDGILLSKAKFSTFNATNIEQVISKIKPLTQQRHIILTEGSFSMDGTCTYLSKLFTLKLQHPDNILLIIDDAHGIAALGKNGLGTIEQLNLNYSLVDLLIGTLSKAFGCHGGFVGGKQHLITYLQQTMRSYLFSTSLPPSIVAAANASLKLIQGLKGASLRYLLANNINYFHCLSKEYNLPIYNQKLNFSPIQLLVFNDEKQVKNLSNKLQQEHILVGGIVYPTVPKSLPRLRISLTACHTQEDIKLLCNKLFKLIYHE